VVSSEIRERCGDLRAAIDQVPRSLGQLHALTVKMEALRHGKVDHLFAYSRPGALRSFVQKEWSSSISFNFVLEDGRVQMRLADEGLAIAADRVGLRFEGTVDHFLTILDYWNMTDAKGRKVDPVFNFHAVNGAQFRPDLVMPFGQVFDQNSLFYRTPLEYLLRT
jgi:hypothetical protein